MLRLRFRRRAETPIDRAGETLSFKPAKRGDRAFILDPVTQDECVVGIEIALPQVFFSRLFRQFDMQDQLIFVLFAMILRHVNAEDPVKSDKDESVLAGVVMHFRLVIGEFRRDVVMHHDQAPFKARAGR